MTSRTLYQKLVDSHTVTRLDEQNVLLFCDLHLMNEYTSPQAFAGLACSRAQVLMPGQNVAMVDHVNPTTPGASSHRSSDAGRARQASTLKRNCARHGIDLSTCSTRARASSTSCARAGAGSPRHGGDLRRQPHHDLRRDGRTWASASAPARSSMCSPPRRWSTGWRTCGSASTAACRSGTTAKDLILALISAASAPQGASGHVIEFCRRARSRRCPSKRDSRCAT